MANDRSTSRLQIKVDWPNPYNVIQMAGILHIERLTNSTPRSLVEFHGLLRRGHLARVALYRKVVAGFLLYQACQTGRQIVSIAVDPEMQRQGIGTMLIDSLKRQMADVPRLTEIVAHVPERQLRVQQFFRANKFRWTKTIEHSSGDVVYVMKCAKDSIPFEAVIAGESASDAPNTDQLSSR